MLRARDLGGFITAVAVSLAGCGPQAEGASELEPSDAGAAQTDLATGDRALLDAATPDNAALVVDAAAIDSGRIHDAVVGPDVAVLDRGSVDSAEPPAAVDPTAPGTHTWTEASGTATRAGRQIPVQALRPDDAALGVVILLPGFQLEAARYGALQQHLASHGFAVLGADPPASLLSVDHVAMALDTAAVFDWALAPGGPLAGLDASLPWAVAGHSLGGKVAVMAAARDARVDAVLAIDPVNGAGNGDYTESRPDIVPDEVALLGIPLGFAGETTNSSGGLGGACAPLDQNFQTFFAAAAASPAAFEWDFTGADHMDFVDDTALCLACAACPDGSADAAQVQAGMRTLAAAFLHTHLAGRADLERYLDGDAVPAGVSAQSRP